jgi:hypothetical protein
MPNELTYVMPHDATDSLADFVVRKCNIPLSHGNACCGTQLNTDVIHLKTAWKLLACLQKARWKLNLDNVDRYKDQTGVS